MSEHTTSILQRKIDKQVYEIQSGKPYIFALPRTHEERLEMLKTFVFKECSKAWATQPTPVVTLKKQFLRELIEKLL